MIRQVSATVVLTLCCFLLPVQTANADDESSPSSWAQTLDTTISPRFSSDEHRSFDFWIGDWDVNWRRQLPGEFHHQKEGSYTHNRVFPILGGKALMEIAWDRDKPEQPSQRGMSIRYFDVDKQRWVMAQQWPSPTGAGWAMVDQLIGDEHHGRLSVYSTQVGTGPDGKAREEHRRYNFSDIRPGVSFRWDGSNTADLGVTWNTWAISEMHRTGDVEPFGPAGKPLPGVVNELLCTESPHGSFDILQGVWIGTKQSEEEHPVRLTAGKAQDGCSIVIVIEVAGVRTLKTLAYADFYEAWFEFRLDDRQSSKHSYFVSKGTAGEAPFVEAESLNIEDEFTHFITAEKMANLNPLRRSVWETIDNSEIVWREDVRQSTDDAWALDFRVRLKRQH